MPSDEHSSRIPDAITEVSIHGRSTGTTRGEKESMETEFHGPRSRRTGASSEAGVRLYTSLAQHCVARFMSEAGQAIPVQPVWVDDSVTDLRINLIYEEAREFEIAALDADWTCDLTDVADALADLLYVVYGAACAYGIDIQPIFDAVHESNMAKFGPGSYKREDGKWIKPPDWQPPNLKQLLVAQGMREE